MVDFLTINGIKSRTLRSVSKERNPGRFGPVSFRPGHFGPSRSAKFWDESFRPCLVCHVL